MLAWAILLGVLSGQSAEVSFPNTPSNGRACQGVANELAALVKTYAKAENASGDCTHSYYHRYTVRVRHDGNPVIASPTWSVYGSRGDCESKLAGEQRWWESTTGLQAFHSYCSLDEEDQGFNGKRESYSPRFFAVGTPKSTVEVVSLRVNGNGFLGDASLFSDIVRLSKERGFPAVQSWMSTLVGESKLLIRFDLPSDSPLLYTMYRRYVLKNTIATFVVPDFFNPADPMRFRSGDQCKVQLSRAKQMMEPYWDSPVVWFCMWEPMLFRATLWHLRIDATEESFERVAAGRDDGAPFTNRYATESQCEADKARVVAYYRKEYGADRVPGALCSYRKAAHEKDPIQVFVYVKKT